MSHYLVCLPLTRTRNRRRKLTRPCRLVASRRWR